MNALPVEIQLAILEQIYYSVPPEYLHQSFQSDTTLNISFAAAFFAARTSAPGPPPTTLPARKGAVRLVLPRIGCITYPLLLRTSLAAALPAWRGALCGIPGLWTHIAVPLDPETWGPEVLGAVREALACARGEPLDILITRAPFVRGTAISEDDGVEVERSRVMEVMALLVPHIARWRSLSVCTLHAGAHPFPTIDFAGNAPMLRELHLRADPLSCAPITTPSPAPAGPHAPLDMPHLRGLTMDAHAFRAVYLHKPDALLAVCDLTLCGPAARDASVQGPPAMSVRSLLVCAAQMPSLEQLSLDGPHLEAYGEEGEGSTVLDRLIRLRCANLPEDVLEEILELAEYDSELDDGEQGEGLLARHLEICSCALPPAPSLEDYTNIELVDIPEGENIVSFLEYATSCLTLKVADCEAFSVKELSETVEPTPEQPHFHWLVPRLKELSVNRCSGVRVRQLRTVMLGRKWRGRTWGSVNVARLEDVTLDGKAVRVMDDDHGDGNGVGEDDVNEDSDDTEEPQDY